MVTKRRKYLIIFIFIIGLPLWMWVAWLLTPIKPLNIAIVDKTVLTQQVREHVSFNWVLTNMRIVNKERKFYRPVSDYFGVFPERVDVFDPKLKAYEKKGFERYSYQQIDSIADALDMIYYADTYGIYSNEWLNILILEHSRLLYGGMSETDIHMLSAMKSRKKLILTEFNDMATPTEQGIRDQFTALFGVKWTGWAGRYFEFLDTLKNRELPFWLKKGYVKQHGGKWPFKKAGIALVNEDGRIEVLEYGTHLNYEFPLIISNDTTTSRFNVTSKIEYPYWFDINKSSEQNTVLSRYVLDTNENGDSILRKNNIPKIFPAAIERKTDCNFYYFCGDFADNPVSEWLAHLKYINNLKYALTVSRGGSDVGPFFWKYYVPLIRTIMKENFKK